MNKYEINIYEQIAKNIKKYRNIVGISQAELAERVGVSHEFIRRNESKKGRKSFSIDTLWKISLALDINPGLLFEIDMDDLINTK
jgi:transcriptional regulator with XRE-family HTH domain